MARWLRNTDGPHGVPFPGEALPRERWTRTRVPLGPPGRRFDWEAAFGRAAPRVLDLGCGNGRFLVGSALRRPDLDHLGIELVPRPSASRASGPASAASRTPSSPGGTRRSSWRSDAPRERGRGPPLPPAALLRPGEAGPPPVDAPALLAIHRALVPGGLLVFQTDNPAYARYARRVVPALFDWRERDGPWPDAPEGRTLREIVARAKRLRIVRAECVRRDLPPEEAAARAESLPAPDFDANRPAARRRPAARPPRKT